jgi:predicted amidohydrolase
MQPFTVACCQVRAYDLADAETNLAGILRALDEAGAAGAQLVLLPECAYPAYYLGDSDPYAKPGVRPFAEVAALLGARAKRHGYWLAAGMAVPHADGTLTNSGVVFGPDGEQRGRYDKSFLWHFDTRWFQRGRDFPVFDMGFARAGILICADGRQPEVARMLHVHGAEVICDLTAWVSWAREPAALTTTQCEYLMPVRAFENNAWVAAADKWGVEDGTIVYAGRSTVIDPAGATRVCAPSTGDTVVVYRVEPMAVPDLVPRRPALYRALTRPVAETPALAIEREPVVPGTSGARVAVGPGPADFDPAEIARRFAALRRQDTDVVVFPGMRAGEGWQVGLDILERAVREHGGVLVFGTSTTGCVWTQSAVLVHAGGTIEHTATHGRGITLGETPAPLIPTRAGNVALLCGDEGYVPEVARCLALDGADVLAWPLFEPHPMAEAVARARADENRLYVAAAWPGGGRIVSPEGAVLTAIPEGFDVAMAAGTHPALSRWKDRAPATHVLRDRVPEAYADLAR